MIGMSCNPLFWTVSKDSSVQQQITDFKTIIHQLVVNLGMPSHMRRVRLSFEHTDVLHLIYWIW